MNKREVWFQTSKSGQRRAYYFSTLAARVLPLRMAEAELKVASGEWVQITRPDFL